MDEEDDEESSFEELVIWKDWSKVLSLESCD